jgi:hypothetical protein
VADPAAGESHRDERRRLQGWIGTLDPALAVRIQQAYPLAFFDQHLRGRREHLLDSPNPAFPEVKFIPMSSQRGPTPPPAPGCCETAAPLENVLA